MPLAAKRDELLLLVSPEVNAAIDVEALAGAFNISSAQAHGRIIPIPEDKFNIKGAQAIITTKDFFVIADTVFETAQLWNPDSLQNNQWLHHHSIISASRFAPAVLFTSETVDEIIMTPNPVVSVGSITTTDSEGATVTDVTRGEVYQLTADVVTEKEDGTSEAVRWSIDGNVSLLTYISDTGVLHVGGTEEATGLTVRATTVWLDPEGVETSKTATAALTVSGEKMVLWPRTETADGDPEPVVTP
jgi:hypothetical protein